MIYKFNLESIVQDTMDDKKGDKITVKDFKFIFKPIDQRQQ